LAFDAPLLSTLCIVVVAGLVAVVVVEMALRCGWQKAQTPETLRLISSSHHSTPAVVVFLEARTCK
jgi:hypothetical protein